MIQSVMQCSIPEPVFLPLLEDSPMVFRKFFLAILILGLIAVPPALGQESVLKLVET